MKRKIREELFRIECMKKKVVQKYLLKIGLTPGQGQARILIYLSVHAPAVQKEVADACMLDETTISRVIDKMERQGLVVKSRDPQCRRSCRIGLTERGVKKAEEVRSGFKSLEEQLCRGMSANQQKQLADCLEIIRGNLDDCSLDGPSE